MEIAWETSKPLFYSRIQSGTYIGLKNSGSLPWALRVSRAGLAFTASVGLEEFDFTLDLESQATHHSSV